jgi:uncharacterized protein YkwD
MILNFKYRFFDAFVFSCAAFASGCGGAAHPSDQATIAGTGSGGVIITGSPGSVSLDAEEAAFVTLLNQYRIANGLRSLEVSLALTEASKWLSQDMAANNYLNHTDSLGRDPYMRMAAFGYDSYDYAGENIAAGNESAADTFTQWKNSAPHNANMLDSDYAAVGLGRAYGASSDYGWYWTTDFGSTVDALLPLGQR